MLLRPCHGGRLPLRFLPFSDTLTFVRMLRVPTHPVTIPSVICCTHIAYSHVAQFISFSSVLNLILEGLTRPEYIKDSDKK